MNSGKIKWNINISATINTRKNSEEDITELKNIIDSIKEFNDVKDKAIFGKNHLKKVRGRKRRNKGMSITSISNGNKMSLNFNKDIVSPYVFNDSFEGIKNIQKWFELIVTDRDWDHRFIVEVLRFKINNTANYIESKQRHLNWEQDVKYMRIACKLIDKLWGDYTTEEEGYESEYYKYHESVHTWKPADDNDLAEQAKNIVTAANRDGLIDQILDDDDYEPMDLEEVENELTEEYLKTYKGDVLMEIKQISECFDDYFVKNKLMHKKAIAYLKNGNGWSNPTDKQTQAMVISKLKHEKARKLLFKILESKLESWWD